MRFPGFLAKALTLSYDDGVIYDKTLIGIMQKYGLKGTFNVNSGIMTGTGNRLSAEDCLALYEKSGMEVACHGKKHLSLTEVDKAVAVEEVISDRVNLEKLFGHIVNGMAYANGSYDDGVVDILRQCGIKYCRTTVATHAFDIPEDWLRMPATCHHNDARLMELAEQFVNYKPENAPYVWSRSPKLFYLWGHSYEYNNNNNWEIIENFGKFVGGRDDIWYATNGEIYDYVKAFDSLIYSADGNTAYNPTCTDVYTVTLGGKNVVIRAGESASLQ